MDKYELKKRTKLFAHQCVKFASSLPKNKLGLHIEGQLIPLMKEAKELTAIFISSRKTIQTR